MKILQDISLAPYTTFRIGGPAAHFCVAKSEQDVKEAVEFARTKKMPLFVLGGGSNLVIADRGFSGLVVKMEMKGLEFTGDSVVAAAGESWDGLVAEAVARGLWGLENLSGIPGTVGASPVQNIGAYGTEVMDVIGSVRAIDGTTGEMREFTNAECRFSYRDSFFKTPAGKQWIILSVSFRLSSKPAPNISYKDLRESFSTNPAPSQADIRAAVLAIRAKKFPDLSRIGTAGSFWKNPIISRAEFEQLALKYPGIPSFPAENDRIKVPLAWILDKVCALKGYTEGGVALFENQPLVLVARPGATADQIAAFESRIKAIVAEKTGIAIEKEVQFVG